MTLTEFLLARIAEDEAHHAPLAARATPPYGEPHRRWLAECEAKRRIVELHTGSHECVGIKHGRQDCVYVHPDFAFRHDPTLCLLALPYADHPDYREEWKP